MAKRIYSESVKKWAKQIGVPSGVLGSIIFFYILYSIFIGAMTITGYSKDVVCAGTTDDPCYAYINFTANDDIFWYPTNYDPWGRNESFGFNPSIKSWVLQRSWGSGWRTIPMDKSCTGTWCGAPDNNGTVTYSVAWRSGKSYQIRMVGYKNNPKDTIKWSFGSVDPFWYGINRITIDPYIPNPDRGNYSFSIDNGLRISGDNWTARYSVYFVMKNGLVYNWSSIPSSIGKTPWVSDLSTPGWIRKKYGFNFTGISSTIKNNLNYVVLHLEEYENLTMDDVRREGNTIIVKEKVFISHDDLLQNFTIPIINRTDVVIGNLAANFLANLDGTWNITFDPTITISDTQIVSNAYLINITSETGSFSNFTHLNMTSTSPYDGLMGYWNFDNQPQDAWQNRTIFDFSGRGIDGTMKGTATIGSSGCPYGECVNFDGVNIPDDAQLDLEGLFSIVGNSSITLSAWINAKSTQAGSSGGWIFSSTAECILRWRVGAGDTDYIEFILNSFTTNDRTSTTKGVVDPDTWYHVVAMYDNSINNMTIWVNGVNRAHITPTGKWGTCGDWAIGSIDGAQAYGFNGSVDEVMIFYDALTIPEIQAIYDNQSSRFMSTGIQDIPNINLSGDGTENMVNVTLNECQTNYGSGLSGQIGVWNGTGYTYNGTVVNFSSCSANNLTISGGASNTSLRIAFNASTYDFYSPLAIGNITLSSWYEAPETSTCGTLTASYTLVSDVETTETCFTIAADDITLDGAGYKITGTGGDVLGYGIYASNRDNITIKNFADITGFAYDSGGYPGISLLNTNNSKINNVTVTLNNIGIDLSGSSNNNTISNSTISSNMYDGVSISGSNNILTGNIIDSNENNGIALSQNSNNNITDSIISNSVVSDVYLESTSTNNIFLNTSYTSELVLAGSDLTRKWYYRAYVNDTSGNDVTAEVNATNSTGDVEFSVMTNSSGWTNITTITDYVNNGGTRTYYSNYTINATNSSYTTGSQEYNVTASQNNLEHVFTLSVGDTCTYTSGNWNINCADNCNIVSSVDVGGNNITMLGSGTITITDVIYNFTKLLVGVDCYVRCPTGSCFRV